VTTNLKNAIKWLWWIVVLIFVAIYLNNNVHKVTSVLQQTPFIYVSLGFFSILIAKILLVAIMYQALRRFDIHLPGKHCFNVYNITQLGKYIPGSIWQFVGRIGFYKQAGMGNSDIRDTILLETFWVVASAFLVGISLIAITQIDLLSALSRKIPKLVIIIGVAAFMIMILSLLLTQTRKLIISYASRFQFTVHAILTTISLWCVLGFSFWIILLPHSETAISLTYIIGLFALSYALGFVVPFAPAGIGIREAVLVIGLVPYIDTDSAIILATLNRLIYIISEVILAMYAMNNSSQLSKEENST
jgi:uncharacterized membrane protein YbhN (UPF0104 family)